MLIKLISRIYAEGEASSGTEPEKKFTQDDVNKFLAEDRRKHQETITGLKAELEKSKGTAEEKKALQVKLEEMQRQFMTKEELAKADAEKAKVTYEQALTNAQQEATKYKTLFENTIASTAIKDAATDNKAFNPSQIEMLLKPEAKVVPATDANGNPTDGFRVMVPVEVNGVKVDLPVKEAVTKMRENTNFANLFLVDATSGTGRTINNTPGATGVDPNAPPSDPAQYREWRKKAIK